MEQKDDTELREAFTSVAAELNISIAGNDITQQRQTLIDAINELLERNFERLVNLLYRLDINEDRLRQLLDHRNGQDTAPLIADLIIERQLQKIQSRKAFRTSDPIDENEKW